MPNLAAHAVVNLGPYAHGGTLVITAPKTDAIVNFPTLSNGGPKPVNIALTNVPKSVTLMSATHYTLTAGAIAITYNIQ